MVRKLRKLRKILQISNEFNGIRKNSSYPLPIYVYIYPEEYLLPSPYIFLIYKKKIVALAHFSIPTLKHPSCTGHSKKIHNSCNNVFDVLHVINYTFISFSLNFSLRLALSIRCENCFSINFNNFLVNSD